MKPIFSLLFSLILALTMFSACSDDSSSDNPTTKGPAAATLKGKTLRLTESSGSVKLVADHLSETGLTISNVTVDYGQYAPSYRYTKTGERTGFYHMEATKKTYIPYYGTYSYAKFTFNVTLQFTSAAAGSYTGTQRNGEGTTSRIQGTFTLF